MAQTSNINKDYKINNIYSNYKKVSGITDTLNINSFNDKILLQKRIEHLEN